MRLQPKLKSTEERIILNISKADHALIGRGHQNVVYGVVTDLDTAKKYKISAAACGSPRCICDAWAVEVV